MANPFSTVSKRLSHHELNTITYNITTSNEFFNRKLLDKSFYFPRDISSTPYINNSLDNSKLLNNVLGRAHTYSQFDYMTKYPSTRPKLDRLPFYMYNGDKPSSKFVEKAIENDPLLLRDKLTVMTVNNPTDHPEIPSNFVYKNKHFYGDFSFLFDTTFEDGIFETNLLNKNFAKEDFILAVKLEGKELAPENILFFLKCVFFKDFGFSFIKATFAYKNFAILSLGQNEELFHAIKGLHSKFNLFEAFSKTVLMQPDNGGAWLDETKFKKKIVSKKLPDKITQKRVSYLEEKRIEKLGWNNKIKKVTKFGTFSYLIHNYYISQIQKLKDIGLSPESIKKNSNTYFAVIYEIEEGYVHIMLLMAVKEIDLMNEKTYDEEYTIKSAIEEAFFPYHNFEKWDTIMFNSGKEGEYLHNATKADYSQYKHYVNNILGREIFDMRKHLECIEDQKSILMDFRDHRRNLLMNRLKSVQLQIKRSKTNKLLSKKNLVKLCKKLMARY